MKPKPSDRDWIEDFGFENGNYSNCCIFCDHEFNGHKRRVICKRCTVNGIQSKNHYEFDKAWGELLEAMRIPMLVDIVLNWLSEKIKLIQDKIYHRERNSRDA